LDGWTDGLMGRRTGKLIDGLVDGREQRRKMRSGEKQWRDVESREGREVSIERARTHDRGREVTYVCVEWLKI